MFKVFLEKATQTWIRVFMLTATIYSMSVKYFTTSCYSVADLERHRMYHSGIYRTLAFHPLSPTTLFHLKYATPTRKKKNKIKCEREVKTTEKQRAREVTFSPS